MQALLALALALCLSSVVAQQRYRVFYNSNTAQFYISNTESEKRASNDLLVCSGTFANDTKHTGWYKLSIEGQLAVPDALMMEGAGFFEGYMTSQLIDDAIANYAMDTSNQTLMNDLR